MKKNILKVEDLSKQYIIKNSLFKRMQIIEAVKYINFEIHEGDSLGLIGESGCGKSTAANLLLKLIEPTTGNIELLGQDITNLSEKQMLKHRKDIQMIFQYTHAVLDPKIRVEALIKEPLKIHNIVPPDQIDSEVDRLLNMVGLGAGEKKKFPTQLSGGQNQRVIIARAVATQAKIIICDEPVSALDISVQGQILNLLKSLKEQLGLSYLFISHDLKVVKQMCNQIAVMYQGEILEIGETRQILENPSHAYTKQLVDAIL